ncbi:MAG: electron transport complex subunit RsxC [Ruminococcus sp.]|nr:electron transport complex subunit RsxC [Ruminococcus sp.]
MIKKLHGVHLPHKKDTEHKECVHIPLPKTVKIPMLMNMGAPCTPLVKVGDTVTVGQKIGDTDAFFSVPVHASVSGTVTAITDHLGANGATCKAVEIETDGKQTVCPDLKPPVITDRESLAKAVRESGVVGLGGAGFPTHIKLNPKTKIDTLLINGAECEPYITSDYRQMVESPEDIINGIKLLMQHLDIPKAKIGIENNKPEAVKVLVQMADQYPEIDIAPLPTTYPQGAEKVMIYNTTGRIVKEGQLPSDVGVIVMNVSTVAFIYRYAQTGMPLTERRLTIDGDTIKNPCNLIVPIGTSVAEALEFAKCDTDRVKKLISGGPMMGMCLYTPDTPICKPNNAILAFEHITEVEETACIRCGRCMRACPLRLMPTELEKAYKTKNVEALQKFKLGLCMNCGSCTFVCPAGHKLAETNQLAKALLPRK